MSLVSRGQRAADQPAGVAVVTAGQQMGYFKDISAAAGASNQPIADEMKGPQSGGRRPETTGNRGGDHSASGRKSRDAGGCFAADQAVLRPVGSQGSSELSRPGASGEEADSSRLQRIRGGHQTMESDGAGEIVFGHRGLMQDSVQLQGQQKERQQMVLDGCGGEAGEESRNGYGENGGAAACAAANGDNSTLRSTVLVDGEASNGWDTKSASQVLAGSSSGESDCRNNSVHQKVQSECAVTQDVGEIAYCPSGLMQDPAQLQGQQEARQQPVLGGCDGAEEEYTNACSRSY